MAMITIERIVPAGNSSSAAVPNNLSHQTNKQNDNSTKEATMGHSNNEQANISDSTTMVRSNEIYIAVRDADIIFPHNECHRYSRTTAAATTAAISELIQKHLKAILEILRPEDTMKMAVRLESQLDLDRTRYLLVVANESDQSCLLGIDYENEATIGLVLPIWKDMRIMLDGDGGFRITTGHRHHIFKPVSVQAMWSIFQSLHLATKKSIKNNHYEGSGSHRWVISYQNNIKSNSRCLHEWYTVNDQWEGTYNNVIDLTRSSDNKKFEEIITAKLREVMISVDLEQVTSKEIRSKLETHLGRDLSDYKSFIDKEMIRIMGQLEEPSKILDYLYLGSEWNASNFEELKGKGVQKILNVTSEIDNYFPGYFDYYNIRVEDDEATDMLRHLNDTYYYIRKAKDEGVKVLVHCKKGISRSASVVVAYIMKEKCYDLDEALRYVRTHRSTIRPNPAFLQQLIIYQGMLAASNNKNTMMWKSNSDSELQSSCVSNCDGLQSSSRGKNFLIQTRERDLFHRKAETDKENVFRFHRRKSWPPKCNTKDDLIFRSQSNNRRRETLIRSDKNQWPKDNCNTAKQELSRITMFKRVEIKGSRVRERIEDFENKQPTNSVAAAVCVPTIGTSNNLLFKKNITAKNGLVSNLACQFESKESTATNETYDSNEWNTGVSDQVKLDVSSALVYSRLMKPPIPPPSTNSNATAAHPSTHIDDQIECLPVYLSSCEYHAHLTAIGSQYSDKTSSGGLLKRALSYDQMIMLDNNYCYIHSPLLPTTTNVSSSDSSLKKCKKSLAVRSSMDSNNNDNDCVRVTVIPGHHDQWPRNEMTICHQLLQPLHRTCSLPNMADDDHLNADKVVCSRFKNQCSNCKTVLMTPLDLQFLRQMTSHHCNNDNATKCSHIDGFVRRRTEQLETYRQHSSSIPNTAASVCPDESKFTDNRPSDHPPIFNSLLKSSKSFNHSSSSTKSSIESAIMSTTLASEKKSKKTYGKSHPLDNHFLPYNSKQNFHVQIDGNLIKVTKGFGGVNHETIRILNEEKAYNNVFTEECRNQNQSLRNSNELLSSTIESYSIGLLYDRLLDMVQKRMYKQDEIFVSKCRAMNNQTRTIKPTDFGAQKAFENFAISEAIAAKFNELQCSLLCTPLAKLNCMRQILDAINDQLKLTVDQHESPFAVNVPRDKIYIMSDDLLAAVICSLSICQPQKFCSTIEFIHSFSWYLPQNSELGYSFVTFKVAKEYIVNYSHEHTGSQTNQTTEQHQTITSKSRLDKNLSSLDEEIDKMTKIMGRNSPMTTITTNSEQTPDASKRVEHHQELGGFLGSLADNFMTVSGQKH
ncbi:protein phosphatase Slingshot [Dermatophagoides farinae]|uniref:protein phosphatase Slingshot n=1 Tax=Dermatophagoides farinae TaxID=6954 RepID=UPI003F600C39